MERLQSQLELLFNCRQTVSSVFSSNHEVSLSAIQRCLKEREGDVVKLFDLYELGVVCLQQFVVANFVGPPTTLIDLDLFASIPAEQIATQLDTMESSDVKVVSSCSNRELLAVAKLLLVDNCSAGDCSFGSLHWWACRCLWTFQQVLTERSKEIKTQLEEHSVKALTWLKAIEASPPEWLTRESVATFLALFHVESVYHSLGYFEVKKAQQSVTEAVSLRQLKLVLTGKMGKRTAFQTFDLAQLSLSSAELLDDSGKIDVVDCGSTSRSWFGFVCKDHLPLNCQLHHETLLESVKITESDEESVCITNGIDQCVIVALTNCLKRASPMHELLKEELNVYLQKVLENPRIWGVQTAALHLRCVLELEDTKRFERALAQLEELINQFSRAQPSAVDRFSLVWSCNLSPIWAVQKTLAELLMKLGCVSEAIRIYESLQEWEEVVKCYKAMQKKEQAEALVRQLMATGGESPDLLVVLGDLTLNPEYYEKAWELSRHRSAKAQSSLGMLYFVRNQFDKAAAALKLSLDILPLQVEPWFALGFCAMQIEDYELSARAYHRCVNIEPDNFEAWNNLSASYVHLKQKDRAFKLLQEALKFNFENWKIWENFLLVSVDTGHVKEAIEACHRLLDLKEKWADVEVLRILVRRTTESDADGKRSTDLQKLFGRLTANVTNNEDIWELYAEAYRPQSESVENLAEMMEKHSRYLQKAYQIGSQKSGWERSEESRLKLLNVFLTYAEAVLKLRAIGDGQMAEALRSSARLAAKSLLAKLIQTAEQMVDPTQMQLIDGQTVSVKELLSRLDDP